MRLTKLVRARTCVCIHYYHYNTCHHTLAYVLYTYDTCTAIFVSLDKWA